MKKSACSTLGAALVALSVSGAAQAAEGGMPQLNFHDFAPQLVWLLIAFVVLYLIMSKAAVPAIADTLERRQAKIQGDLDAAEKASEETRAAVTAYQKRLADAREEARRLTRERGEADTSAATAELAKLGESRTWPMTSLPTSMPRSPASRPIGARSAPRSPPLPKEPPNG
jgi:F-type H+-transporting ATPase subunit b